MWGYGPSFEDGFEGDTVYSTSFDGNTNDDSTEGSGSRVLSDDSRALAYPIGPARRLLGVIQRLEGAGFQQAADGDDENNGNNTGGSGGGGGGSGDGGCDGSGSGDGSDNEGNPAVILGIWLVI